MNGSVRVVKLGGSLLDLADLAGVLRRWLVRQPAAANVLVVGGGQLADVVRGYDRQHGLGDADAHWLAIGAMELNGRLLASLLPEAAWLDSLATGAHPGRPLSILNPHRFMREDSESGNPLPASWRVTSDSIAARAAELSGASELVLLKSALRPSSTTIDAAVAAGYVDAMFAETSRRVPRVRSVNLREPTFPEIVWHGRALEERPKNE